MSEKPQGLVVEQRSLATTIAQVATPVAILGQPLVKKWADEHFGQSKEPNADAPAPQQQQPKDD